jgi:hypothetical protein
MKELLHLVFEGMTAVGTVAASFSLYFLNLSLREQQRALELDYKWRQADGAVTLMRDFNENVSPHRNMILSLGRMHYGMPDEDEDFMAPLERDECDGLWKASSISEDKGERERAEINASILALLNYFEYVSAAYYNNVVNKEVITEAFKDSMIRWSKCLVQYVNYMSTSDPPAWRSFTKLVEHWKGYPPTPPPAFPELPDLN